MARSRSFRPTRKGKGIVQMRGKAFTETVKRTGKEQIIISEIPYMVNKKRLIEQIAELVNEKKIEASPICATNRTARACASSSS